ncbi:MAG: DUF1013 domain-containing protein [Alphaproteobacteria bacterium]|nr:DUF1013 domain-containing protein [Alphaproteobacteria bacterium]
MPALLMPKATAVWLVDNTTLTFDQIAKLCQLHSLEIQAIADGEVSSGIIGLDPVTNGQLTREEILRCEDDTNAELKLVIPDIPISEAKPKGARYTPISKRNDKPDAIAWLVKNLEDLSDAQIGRLVGTTKPTINAVRDRTHWNSSNLRPRHPVELGLCTRTEIDAEIAKARDRKAKQAKKNAPTQARPAAEAPIAQTPVAEAPVSQPPATENTTVEAAESDSPAPAHEEPAPEITPEVAPNGEAPGIPEETPEEPPQEEPPQDEPTSPPETP